MTGHALERISPELEAAGVQIQTDEDGGYRAIVFPPAITQNYNVLLPVSEIAKTDPNWTPNPRSVRINVETDTYHDSNSRQGERSLNKLGLYKLANVAGLGVPSTRRMGPAEVEKGKIGWQATVQVRRSDGTLEPATASKVIDVEVEREKVYQAVAKLNKPDGEKRAIYERRWLYEREHMESKAETKAVERAIRAALQIPHVFTEQALAKPFLVVGYNHTPDPETARQLALQAAGAVYGPGTPMPMLPPPDEGITPSEYGPAAAGVVDAEASGADDDGAEFSGSEPPPMAAADEDASGGPPSSTAGEDPGQVRFSSGKYGPKGGQPGKTIAEIHALDPNYLVWASENWKAPTVLDAVKAFLKRQATS